MGSIKYYLFTRFFGIVFLQIIILFGFTWKFFSDEYFQASLDESFVQLSNISKNVAYFYNHQIDEIHRLSKLKGFNPYNRQQAMESITQYLDTRKLVTSVHYYNAKGALEFRAKGSDVPDYDAEDHYRKHSDKNFIGYFEKALNEKKAVFTAPLYTRAGIFYHVALVPVFHANGFNVEGILSMAFFPTLNPLNSTLTGLALNPQNFFAITNESGDVIATTHKYKQHMGTLLNHYVKARGVTEDNPYNYRHKELDELKYRLRGKDYYLLSVQVSQLPIFAVLGVSEKVLLDKRSDILNIVTTIIAVSALIGLFTTFVITGRISSGIETLVSAIKDLKYGTYHHKQDSRLQEDFKDALMEIEDLSIEIEKGKLLGNLWGQEQLLRNDEKSGK